MGEACVDGSGPVSLIRLNQAPGCAVFVRGPLRAASVRKGDAPRRKRLLIALGGFFYGLQTCQNRWGVAKW